MSNDKIQDDVYKLESTASDAQFAFREQLLDMYRKSPLSQEDLLFNVGLYTRSSVLVKFIVLNDLYKRFKHIPGMLVEFGTWYGHNLVLLENLRAIYEPFNKQRQIVGFDTFEGYSKPSDKDRQESGVWVEHSYSTQSSYKEYLEELLQVHEGNNVIGHKRKIHSLVAGDVTKTAPDYFEKNQASIVAFAYFDMGLYEPTLAALKAVKPHLVSGSILLMDELTWPESPGEAIAFKEVFSKDEYTLEKCELYPSKCIVTIK
ncbi:class I SAM-dependent methyltransferase [Herbaspirillum robiniae]|uniref:dTDP-6-deoxy-L-hexose 3-O-methyltransferase n=1 Tax=Herbaspirillum robiniae TaxID=2014887 RepID=A0A246WR65_9BURK|nr:TylF/MycF/NovP-related O-methyltransferase [Herbaspirillum robiniae]NUU03884.1 dTDP-6-deoxy-L-hexose 3-O-methyltransferase [Herbaspirillum robiniae]OWY28110.1 dTDP-6-deoxy-L-hexose 3-O-methyltransferase [Herbaspirillum robiniae]